MRKIILAIKSGFIFLFYSSISIIGESDIVRAGTSGQAVRTSNVQGAQDSDLSDFKKQLELMEKTIKKQQEMINALKDKIESKETVAHDSISRVETNEIEQVIDNYLTKEDTREKMAKAGLTPRYFSWNNGLRFESEDGNFKFKLGGRIMNDWGFFDEDNDVLRSTGDQVDGTEFRRARLYLAGEIYENIAFKVQYDFAAGGRPSFRDVYMELKKIPVLGNFRVGHFKEHFSLEELTSSRFTTFMERSLTNTFAPARNTGFMLYNHVLEGRMNWAAGVFRNANDFGDSEGNSRTEGGYSFTGRLTGLPWYEDEGRKLLHVGLSYSHQNAFAADDRDTGFQFKSKPEIHLATDFVDTGHIKADFANLFNPELAIVYGPFSLQAEYTLADIDLKRSTESSANLDGFYLYGSYFLTGEHREYVKKKGYFTRVKPINNFKWGKGIGAIELAARYSKLDLSDKFIDGGKLNDLTLGINWYLNPNTKVMINYVHAEADLSNAGNIRDGNADLLGVRFQIDF